jgi:hypothetical protein
MSGPRSSKSRWTPSGTRLSCSSKGAGVSPGVVARVRELESENERIARHAEFLETKVKELLARVRYVVEA